MRDNKIVVVTGAGRGHWAGHSRYIRQSGRDGGSVKWTEENTIAHTVAAIAALGGRSEAVTCDEPICLGKLKRLTVG